MPSHEVGILSLEKELGFSISAGISHHRNSFLGKSSLKDLSLGIDQIKAKYVNDHRLNPHQLRDSSAVRLDTKHLFDRLGPKIWPDFPERNQAFWLADATYNNLGGRYHRDLFFSITEHRDL